MLRIKISIITLFLLIAVSCKKSSTVADKADIFVDSLLQKMTTDEKIGQLTLYASYWAVTGPVMRDEYINDIRKGRCGNVFNSLTIDYNRKLQKIAVEETRLGIPLLFGLDVIHGYKTIFPVSIAEACSWNPELIEMSARYAAMEAASSGLNWTFAPMVDISRDPRWGRVSEGAGEDPYLGSVIAAAKVKGFQGSNLSDPLTIAACIKHFAGYGAPVAGRDYNTVDMSELSFRQDYLPPYKAGIDAGAVSVMASFNDIFGVPATASNFLLTKILREEWGFIGFVVSDYIGVDQLTSHGVASNRKHAGELAINAGMDMDMQSAIYSENLASLIDEGKVAIKTVDDAVRRILLVKYQLGLFDDPYRYFDEKRESEVVYSPKILNHALQAARESIVLLKNDTLHGKSILPVSNNIKKIAVIGPLGNDQADMIGSWHALGEASKVVTVLGGLKNKFPSASVEFAEGCDFHSPDKKGFQKALMLAQSSDLIVVAIGEMEAESGEAASRSDIGLPGIQEELALEMIKTEKPVVVLIMAERPLTFPKLAEKAPAILCTWHLGTRAGDAIADVISGDYNPSGKLVMSFPRNAGQIPVFYNYKNTGRPFDVNNHFTSKYLDVSNDPQYPFGFGLSYTHFEYSDISLSKEISRMTDTLVVSVKVTNTGNFDGEEIVQLYIRDMVASVTRPVKELKGFTKIFLKKGESKGVSFLITAKDLKFYNTNMKFITEPGDFKIFLGGNPAKMKETIFTLVD